jgi:acetoin utilization deacetylase AcuC-like enzyme
VVYLSMHEYPYYPGTGWLDEDGDQAGSGHIINMPFPAGTAGDVYAKAFDRIVVPVLREFDPHWILVSAGYDAHRADPLANFQLVDGDYGRMAGVISGMAPPARTIFFLEGGYDLDAMEGSVAATLRGFAGEEVGGEAPEQSPVRAHQILDLAAQKVAADWTIG